MAKLNIYWRKEKQAVNSLKLAAVIGINEKRLSFNDAFIKKYQLTEEMGVLIADDPKSPGSWFVAFLEPTYPAAGTSIGTIKEDWYSKNKETTKATGRSFACTIPKIEQFAELPRGRFFIEPTTEITFDDPALKYKSTDLSKLTTDQREEYENDMDESRLIQSLKQVTFYKILIPKDYAPAKKTE